MVVQLLFKFGNVITGFLDNQTQTKIMIDGPSDKIFFTSANCGSCIFLIFRVSSTLDTFLGPCQMYVVKQLMW